MKTLRKKHVATAVAIASAVAVTTSLAFKPDLNTFGHTMITQSVAGKGYAYGGKTVLGWNAELSDGSLVGFSVEGLDGVVYGVQSTDFMFGGWYTRYGQSINVWGELNNEVAHCDNDKIDECGRRLVTLKTSVVDGLASYISTGDKETLVTARITLGKALHTLQDFYAHSNFADTHPSGNTYFAELSTNPTGAGGKTVPEGDDTCAMQPEPFNSTWAKNGGNYLEVGKGTSADLVTTGFFQNFGSGVLGRGVARDSNGVRCDHGLEAFGHSTSGINKDAPYSPFTPSPYFLDYTVGAEMTNASSRASPLHAQASFLAARHTSAFLSEVVAKIKEGRTAETADKMIEALLGNDSKFPSVVLVADTTGSMGDVIDGLKVQMKKVVADNKGIGTTQFKLLPFNDPALGDVTSGNAATVSAAIDALVVNGGGDCPEVANAALLKALDAAPPGSALYLFTDADIRDPGLESEVINLAKSKSISVNAQLSGYCNDTYDAGYTRIAQATGGSLITTEHNGAAAAAAFAGIANEPQGIAARPVVTEQGTVDAPHAVDVPVDSGATLLTVKATFGKALVALTDPNGVAVTAATPGVTQTEVLGGRIYSVRSPAAGVWKLLLTPVGVSTGYSLSADVNSKLSTLDVSFSAVEQVGRSGHEANLPYTAGPPLNKATRFQLRFDAPAGATATAMRLLAADGTVLAKPALAQVADGIYVGQMTTPSQPFRVQVQGVDASGKAFARVRPGLIAPRRYMVQLEDTANWVAGQTNSMRIRLTNFGAAAGFDVHTTLNGVAVADPNASLQIAAGASASKDITLTVPNSTSDTQKLALTVVVDGEAETLTSSLHALADTDGDGVPDAQESGPGGGQPDYDGNGDGVADRLQATVISLYSRQQAAYMTLSVEGGTGRFAQASARPIPMALGNSAAMADNLPFELLGFKVVGLSAGGTAKLVLRMPSYVTLGGFKGWGVLAGQQTEVLYTLPKNAVPGVSTSGAQVTLSLVDGGKGDNDLAANGQLSVLAGPSEAAMRDVSTAQSGSGSSDSAGSGGGGGGCTVGRDGRDASLPLLALVAAGLAAWRRRRAARRS